MNKRIFLTIVVLMLMVFSSLELMFRFWPNPELTPYDQNAEQSAIDHLREGNNPWSE